MTRLLTPRILAAVLLVVVSAEVSARLGFRLIGFDTLVAEPAYSGRLSAAHQDIIRTRILGATGYVDYSSTLGWTIKPHGRSELYQANSEGIRASREYTMRPPASVVRLAAFGDSFTHSDDVANPDTWESQMEALNPGLEVLNFGVGGFGTDQALLRYETEGVRFHPQVVLLGFFPENISRVVSVFRPFYYPGTGIPMSKPRFTIRDGRMVLLPNPMEIRERYDALLTNPAAEIARLGEHDDHYRRSHRYHWTDASAALKLTRLVTHRASLDLNGFGRIGIEHQFNPDSEAFRVLAAVFSRFHDVALRHGSRPIVLIFPSGRDVEHHRTRTIRIYDPLLAFFKANGIEYIDLMEAFEGYGPDEREEFFRVHYSARANGVVARYVNEALIARAVIGPASTTTAR